MPKFWHKEFANSANRRRHEIGVHEGLLRWTCFLCDQEFADRSYGRTHMANVHNVLNGDAVAIGGPTQEEFNQLKSELDEKNDRIFELEHELAESRAENAELTKLLAIERRPN